MTAHIFQINISPGGVPKHPEHRAELTSLGLVGDDHEHPNVHGGPEAALCLYSLELILALQAEGHPVFAGSLGENLTLTGLDWEQMQPGARLRLGPQVVVEITRYTTPCSAIVGSFSDLDSKRVSQKLHPGWSRVYARVLQTGQLTVGDTILLEQAPA